MSLPASASRLLERSNELGIHDGIVVAHGSDPRSDSTAMRLMRSSLLARIYESFWRPTIVALVSSMTYRTEDAVMDRYVEHWEGLRVLDLCCGTARASRRLVHAGAEVLGIDRSRAMLVEARRCCADARLVLLEGNAERQFARPAAFDVALCFAALHLTQNPAAVIDAARAALQPGGILFVWAAASRGVFGVAAVRRASRLAGLDPFLPGAVADMVEASGFELVESVPSGVVELVVARRL